MGTDWTALIVNILSLITISGITSLVVMKYTKKEAAVKANSSENKEQAERIDLGAHYVDQMLSVMDKLQRSFDTTSQRNDEYNSEQKDALARFESKLNEMHDEITDVKNEVSCIVKYLNGAYQKYKEDATTENE